MSHSQVEAVAVALRAAMLSSDVPSLEKLLAPEMIWIHASSKVDDRAAFLRGFGEGRLQCFALEHTHVDMRVYGPAVVVTGIIDMDVAVDGARRSTTNRYTSIWISQHDQYRLVLWQSTRMQPAA
jgi:hypothetical protein